MDDTAASADRSLRVFTYAVVGKADLYVSVVEVLVDAKCWWMPRSASACSSVRARWPSISRTSRSAILPRYWRPWTTDGNTPDDVTHLPDWDELVSLVGNPGFSYVAVPWSESTSGAQPMTMRSMPSVGDVQS